MYKMVVQYISEECNVGSYALLSIGLHGKYVHTFTYLHKYIGMSLPVTYNLHRCIESQSGLIFGKNHTKSKY